MRSCPAGRDYHLLPAVRGDLLTRLGRNAEAALAFRGAAALAGSVRERDLLLRRAVVLGQNSSATPSASDAPMPAAASTSLG